MSMSKTRIQFWRKEMELLDTLYRKRLDEWQSLIDLYDLRFRDQIRDLSAEEIVRVSRFYPLVRQIIGTVAFNYPKLFFTIEDDAAESESISAIMERASQALMRVTDLRSHVHQAIFDALFCGVGWIRIDYNPPGDDMIPPYVANDSMAEDMPGFNRCPPGFVHVDPLTPPHALGHARYIRERMWMPLKQLRDDENIQHRREIKATTVNQDDRFAFGEANRFDAQSPDEEAQREAVENGDFVLCDRIHDRMNRRLIMFAEGVDEPIQDVDHPYIKMSFPQRMSLFGAPLFEEDGYTPLLDLEQGEPATGWLVENGLPFIPVKFDLHPNSFYPLPHLAYVRDIQDGIVESLSRQANLLKRTSRQGLMAEQESENNPELLNNLRKGVDGEWHEVISPDNFKELNYGTVPPDQYNFEDRMRMYEEEITRVSEMSGSSANPRTATEASIVASSASINREWMESAVSRAYELCVRNAFQIMGDPRYTPENFQVNVAPDGAQRLSRALRNADFLWNFRIHVQAGSMQPLFEQIQRTEALGFFDRAIARPSFDPVALDKFLTSMFDIVDPEKLMRDDTNDEARRAAELENDRIISQMQDPGVVEGQDHRVHVAVHRMYQQHPTYQQMVMQAQTTDPNGIPANPQAAQYLQQVDAIMQQHVQQHAQIEGQETDQVTREPAGGGGGAMSAAMRSPSSGNSIIDQVRSNAQYTANTVQSQTREAMDGA